MIRVQIYCDNLGIIAYGNNHSWSLPEKQAQSDVLILLLQILRNLQGKVEYKHVYGHLDDTISFGDLNISQQPSVIADKLAKEGRITGVQEGLTALPIYSPEQLHIYVANTKVYSSMRTTLYIPGEPQ